MHLSYICAHLPQLSFFTLKHWLQHRRKAKNRHGVHSPFVYTFNEDVLNHSRNLDELVANMAQYYNIPGVYRKGNVNTRSAMVFGRLIVLPLTDHLTLTTDITEDDIVLLHPLYTSPAQAHQWQTLCAGSKVTMSIDLFNAGLLLFRKEFKIKQHFLLRW